MAVCKWGASQPPFAFTVGLRFEDLAAALSSEMIEVDAADVGRLVNEAAVWTGPGWERAGVLLRRCGITDSTFWAAKAR